MLLNIINRNMTVFSLPRSANKVVDEYKSIPLGGKKVICPYYINPKSQRGGLRVSVGKGDPGEISREVKVIAQLKGVDLNKLSVEEIRQFMMDNHIGIDCSGLVVHIYNYWLKNQGDKPLINYLKFKKNDLWHRLKRKLRPLEQIGANTLTNDENTVIIKNYNDVRPGDFIRSKGLRKNSHHIIIISKVIMREGIVEELEYIHSIKGYEDENGLRFGSIKIINPKLGLDKQQWEEIKNGRNWTYEGYMNQKEDNGLRRLTGVKLNYLTKEDAKAS